ncbi:SDR family NAD(P)-dependent oxidoreductase [Chryseobacterium sp. KLBC 52]|uniref:SDR family NAD(P)-dependent oxidoreductase n=1 Tax=Chryseobacterium sp. KLBC 52 TaxID=1862702 RepID=UPI0013B40F98|nr:SDR family NAD(P)-dependent oxidoreductase [Chryseobacterium sp. KLBC 52]
MKRIVLITGAGSGIGRSTALRLSKNGYRIILNGRNESALSEIQDQINTIAGEKISETVIGSITDIETTEKMIQKAYDTWNTAPSVLIANAGISLPGSVTNSDDTKWDNLINTNFIGLMNQLRVFSLEATNVMDGITKDIVVIGSNIGRNVSPFNSVYGATKFAAYGVTEGLRRELAPKGIRVSLIEPGMVQTNLQATAGYDMEWFKNYEAEIGPILSGEDIAQTIDFILSLPGNVTVDSLSIRPTRQVYP